jgi:hypothetical protein
MNGHSAGGIECPGTRNQSRIMARIVLTVIGLLILVIAAGLAYFALGDLPAPQSKIERVIPDSRLPK